MNTPTAPPSYYENLIQVWLQQFGIPESFTEVLAIFIICSAIILLAIVATYIFRKVFLPRILTWVKLSTYKWDDILFDNALLHKVSWFIPVMIISLSLDAFIDHEATAYILLKRLTMSGFVIVAILTLTSLLNAINDIHRLLRKTKRYHLQAYVDAGKIILYLLGAIFITSIFTGKSPWGIFSILGGLTAVTMLIFKDSILGFVASIQLTSTDMVQVGDWIEMPQYGADGDVIAMTIHSIRVQNWDKTITTIPTHALVSSSFKNWRGMSESGGRRIKRAINIDITSITFCDDEMLERFGKYSLIQDYITKKSEEISVVNQNSPADTSLLINGRRQTNIGIFRAYIAAYLKSHHNIHQDMTFLVRQLPPKEHGLPIEIYVFSNDIAWANYEAIQADIFDHLLAAAPEFGLRSFQNPTGFDMRSLGSTN